MYSPPCLWNRCIRETCCCPEGWYCCNEDRFSGVSFQDLSRGEKSDALVFCWPRMTEHCLSLSSPRAKALEPFLRLWAAGVDAIPAHLPGQEQSLSKSSNVCSWPRSTVFLSATRAGWLQDNPQQLILYPILGLKVCTCCCHLNSLKGGAEVSILTKQSLWGRCYSCFHP